MKTLEVLLRAQVLVPADFDQQLAEGHEDAHRIFAADLQNRLQAVKLVVEEVSDQLTIGE